MTAYVVTSGQTSSGITLNSSDTLTVLSGGTAFATTINSGGSLTVSQGGTATFDTVNSGGLLTTSAVYNSNNTINGGGSETVASGGYAEFDTINSGGSLAVLSGGLALSTTLHSGGLLTVSSGGSGFVTINGGSEIVASGGNESYGTISSGGSETVLSGGEEIGAYIRSGGSLTVSSGGIASATTISSGGSLTVSSGGAVSFTDNIGGSMTVLGGGSAWDSINNGGLLTVSSGGRTSIDAVGGGGRETVFSGGTAVSPIIDSGGVLDLRSGAVVSGGITFDSDSGGQLQIAGSAMPSTTISGFIPGDTFDLTSIAFDSAGSATLGSGNVLHITENGNTYNLNLSLAQFFTGDFFHLASDGSSGTVVTENTTASPPPPPPSPPPPSPPPPSSTPSLSPVVLKDFSWAQGWGSAGDPRIVTDVNGDGTSDYVGFGYSATFIAYGGTFTSGGVTGPGFTSATAAVDDFGTSEGYTADDQRGAAAAGVGAGDILYGQGYAGIYWYEATGETAKTDAAGSTYDVLQYQTSPNFYGNFGSSEGWTSDNGFQILKTSSTDSSASILGFGDDGIVVGPDAFSSGATAADSYVIPLSVGNNSGWNQTVDVRTFTDINGKTIDLNGDGIADFVGMGPNGLVYAYGSESGGTYSLGPLETADIDGSNSDLGEAQGWTDATTVRDIVYDAKTGYYDIIAFGAAGVYVSMGQDPTTHNGQPFGQLYLALANFGSDQGWSVSGTPRLVGDVTGDGIPDIVGFGTSDTYVAVGSYDSSGNLQFKIDPTKTIADYGSSEGWSSSTDQTVRTLGTFAATGSTGSQSDLILSGAYNTEVVPLTSGSSTGSSTTSRSDSTTLSSSLSGSSGPSPSTASPAFTTTIDPTVAITGSPVEGTTLTASAVVTGGFTGTTEFQWQRFYAGSWWNIPIELSPYTAGETFTYETSPTYVVREEDEDVSALRVEADFVDNTGLTVAVVDSPSIGPVLDEPASLSLSPITGSVVPGATLSVSAQVVTDEGTFTPIIEWQRFYSGGWWDIPVELSPYSAGEVFTYVTTPTYVVRAEDASVLAIRAEAIYVDDTGQTFTAFSSTGTSGAALTITQPPQLNAAGVTLGDDVASIALAITAATYDTDYTLSDVTLSGVPSGWSLSGDGAASIAGGTWTAGSGGLSGLNLVAPSSLEEESFTLSVTASESAVGPSGILTATATTSFVVSVSAVAEAPVFSGTSVWSGTDEASFALTGIVVSGADSDDTLGANATLSGLSAGWTLYDGAVALTASGGVASLPVGDLGALGIAVPDGTAPAADNLTLTVASSEGGATTSGSEVLVVSVSAVAEAPVFSGTSVWSGTDEASFALSGIVVSGADSDDTLGANATLSGLSAGWTLYDGAATLTAAGGVASLPVSDLGSLRIAAPSGTATDSLTLTVASSEGGATTSGSEILVVSVSAVAEAPVFSGTSVWSGTDEASFALSGIVVSGEDSDDTLGANATLSGLSAGWTLYDGSVSLTATGGVASLPVGDLGALGIAVPDGTAPATDSLTLTVASSEGGATTSGSEVLVVSVSAVAEAPTFGGPTMFSGGTSVTLSGLSVTANDPDDTLSATITGLSSGWTLVDTQSSSSFTGTSITAIPVSDLGALVVVAPGSATDLLTLTISSSEGGSTTSASETLAVTATVAAPPSFSGGTTFYGGASVTLSGLGASAAGGDTLGANATLSGLSSGWTLVDTQSSSSFTGTSITAIPVSDLGSLVVVAPAGTTSGSDVLILTVSSSLGASTTDGSESLTLVAQSYTSLSSNEAGANLTRADLTGADLAGVNFTGATLTDATLAGADLFFANLTGATLTGANLTGANLFLAGAGGADLSGADLSGAILIGTNLTSVNLTDANLSNALVEGANLTNATLTGADLEGTNLTGTDLTGADLTGAILPLQLSLLGASASGHDITGGVLDGFAGAITISAVDDTTTVGTITVSYSQANQLEVATVGGVTFAQGDTITVTAKDSEGAFYSVSATLVVAAPAGAAGSPINLALADPAGGSPIAVTIAGIPAGWSLNAGTALADGSWTVETADPSALAITPAGGLAGAAVVSVSESWLNADGSSVSAFVSDNVEAYAPGNPIFALSGDDTLTGSGASDLFVFAHPIAIDRVYDFQSASDQIDLIGFPGIASFADLQDKIANDSNGNAVLTLGSGETITIVGVDAAALGAGNFLFNDDPVTSNAGDMTIGDGATLPLGGTVTNTGTIALNSAGEETDLVLLSGGVTLQGGGEVTLSDNAGNAIVGSGADTTLTNFDNIVSGAGRLGDTAMTLNNSGVIDATGVNPLIIDTGSNPIANSGTMEVTGAGGLVIKGAVTNSGTLSADGGNLTIDGAVTGAGIAVIAGTATLEFGAASSESTSFAPGAGTLKIDQSASFTGVVSGFAAGDSIDLPNLAFGSNMALGYTDNGAGGGVVTVGNAVQVVDLALLGQYAAAGFHAQSDSGGGTLITYTLQTSASDPTSLTNPTH
jgi:autotransporter passenger strand-loop-strand repeat protein